MIILSRKRGESVRVGDNVTLTVVTISRGKTLLRVTAPRGVEVKKTERKEK